MALSDFMDSLQDLIAQEEDMSLLEIVGGLERMKAYIFDDMAMHEAALEDGEEGDA